MAHEYASTLFIQVASSNLLHIDYFNILVKSLVRGDKRLRSLLLIWPFRQTTAPKPALGPCGRHPVQCLTRDQKAPSLAEAAHSSTCITNNLTQCWPFKQIHTHAKFQLNSQEALSQTIPIRIAFS